MSVLPVIILTTTVNTGSIITTLYQINPQERKQTYLKSIRQWLEKTNLPIIVVENSGDNFEELCEEKEKYKSRFEVISYVESQVEEAKYLANNESKGLCELFSINYAVRCSKIINERIPYFVIKITGRYFIPELEDYLKTIDLSQFDAMRQANSNRCELVGSSSSNFPNIFKTLEFDGIGHVEDIYKIRIAGCEKVLVCKEFSIERTQRGGLPEFFYTI